MGSSLTRALESLPRGVSFKPVQPQSPPPTAAPPSTPIPTPASSPSRPEVSSQTTQIVELMTRMEENQSQTQPQVQQPRAQQMQQQTQQNNVPARQGDQHGAGGQEEYVEMRQREAETRGRRTTPTPNPDSDSWKVSQLLRQVAQLEHLNETYRTALEAHRKAEASRAARDILGTGKESPAVTPVVVNNKLTMKVQTESLNAEINGATVDTIVTAKQQRQKREKKKKPGSEIAKMTWSPDTSSTEEEMETDGDGRDKEEEVPPPRQ